MKIKKSLQREGDKRKKGKNEKKHKLLQSGFIGEFIEHLSQT
jgi:hypothetical protein